MNIIEGDLLTLGKYGTFDVIVHGCNCFNTMGAGIAKSVKEVFPEAYAADCETEKGSREKLGTFTTAEVDCHGHSLTVVNAYIQFDWRGTGSKADYHAIRSVFKKVKASFEGQAIGYPLIGAGLAGGDWPKIAEIIDHELSGEDHTLVKYVP